MARRSRERMYRIRSMANHQHAVDLQLRHVGKETE